MMVLSIVDPFMVNFIISMTNKIVKGLEANIKDKEKHSHIYRAGVLCN
jgi:hypothetical protein